MRLCVDLKVVLTQNDVASHYSETSKKGLTAPNDWSRAVSSSKIFIAGLALDYSQPMNDNGALAQAFTLKVRLRLKQLCCSLRQAVQAIIIIALNSALSCLSWRFLLLLFLLQ